MAENTTITIPKLTFAKIWYQLSSEQQQHIFDGLSKEDLDLLRAIISECK